MEKLNIMLEHSESIAKLAEALNKAQNQMEKAKKDSNNPFFKSKYADLSAVWEACKEAVLGNGFCVMQPLVGTDERGNTLIATILAHSSGEWIKGVLAMPATKQDPQQVGSAITYGRRYSLAAMLNVMLEDDDGESAMGRGSNQAQKSMAKTKASPKQLTYFKQLIDANKIPVEALEQARVDYQVEKLSELPSQAISNLINLAVVTA